MTTKATMMTSLIQNRALSIVLSTLSFPGSLGPASTHHARTMNVDPPATVPT